MTVATEIVETDMTKIRRKRKKRTANPKTSSLKLTLLKSKAILLVSPLMLSNPTTLKLRMLMKKQRHPPKMVKILKLNMLMKR